MIKHGMLQLETRITRIRERVEARLARLVPDDDVPPEQLHRAIRYSLLAPGKRIRPVITVLTADALGCAGEAALDPACAVEMVHTASLILDDMPFMDDAAFRRGQPTAHRAHGLDLATLASISLLNRAYAVLAKAPDLDDATRLELVDALTRMIGDQGVVSGQVRDLHHVEERLLDPAELERMAREKTGALFVACVEIGARVAQAPADWVEAVRSYAANLGMCFQVLDDLVDLQGSPSIATKDVGQDRHKVTFVSAFGAAGARAHAERYLDCAVSALDPIGPSGAPLAGLARGLLESSRALVART